MNDRMKAVRKSTGLNQTEFAARIGLSQNYWSLVESGNREPSNQVYLAIIREYGVNEKWLRTGEGEMFAPQTQEEELASVVGKLLRADNPEWYKRQLILAISDMKAETILDAIEQIKKRFADQ